MTGNVTPLSVQVESRIERESKSKILYSPIASKKIVITKWVSTVILGVLLLGCVTYSKISILDMSHEMNKTDSTASAEYFVMLQILAVVPSVVSLIRGVWAGAFRNDLPWPSKKALIVGLFVSLAESIGIALFIFNIPGLMDASHAVLLMNSVFLVPLISFIYASFKNRAQSRWKALLKYGLALILEIAGFVITCYFLKDIKQSGKLWMVPVAVLLLSISWTPGLFNYLLKPDVSDLSTNPEENRDPPPDSKQSERQPSADSKQSEPQPSADDRGNIPKCERATWKLTIYMSFFKTLFTFGISMLIFYIQALSVHEFPADYTAGWRWSRSAGGIYYFVANIVTSIIGYLIGCILCTACMQGWAFYIPLVLTTPLSMVLLSGNSGECETGDCLLFIIAAVSLVLAPAMSIGWLIFKSESVVTLKEDQIFWVPMYNSALLEQWLLLMRRGVHNDVSYKNLVGSAKKGKVFICTTMFRETDSEMRQLLESIQKIYTAQRSGGRQVESHVFFDGAVKDKNPTELVLQLVSLVESTLGVKAEECTKTMTPYGMTLEWTLKVKPKENGMKFKIHLKDNFKVKNKKRWSQVMYMSYVLDFPLRQTNDATEDESFILTTDADVKFTPDSVEALLDLMARDQNIGAVCARTHPLGSGPLVWYQIFEYAIGHWFQKAAEHVLGSVLCSPGCFSVYRCKAVRDIVPKYASNVEKAFEFLTKDMGEDRWFCTLMVQSGWRIEYCAASENSTNCPEEFDEFFKQRRRWVVSTIANLMLLIKEWHLIAKLNKQVSFMFLIYQGILLFATLIGPSSVILVVSGGLKYGWDWGTVPSLVFQLVICVGFTLVCLFTSSKTQLKVAKILTFFYAVIMTAVVVGTAVQISKDFNGTPASEASFISHSIKVSTTTVYIVVMTGIFLLTGLLHLKEFVYLLHGVWFLLCLPAGYLILMIYSICNITDRSWGTRELKTHSVLSQHRSWQNKLKRAVKSVFFCCLRKPSETKSISIQTEDLQKTTCSRTTSMSESPDILPVSQGLFNSSGTQTGRLRSLSIDLHHHNTITEVIYQRSSREINEQQDDADSRYNDQDDTSIQKVERWLRYDMQQFAQKFINNGYENTMLISGMTEEELKDNGVKSKGKMASLMEKIKQLPDYEIQAEVPKSLEDWLKKVGLKQYRQNFIDEQIHTSEDMEVLKSYSRQEIEKELKITKPGHIKRLMYAISNLRQITESEARVLEVKEALTTLKEDELETTNKEEYEFWNKLRKHCLMPQSTAFGLEGVLKKKLVEIRNQWLMIFAVSNTLWLILICTLAYHGELLSVFGSNPVGLVVLLLIGLVLIIQFLTMIAHRISTMTHFLRRAPYKFGAKFNTTWAFDER